MIYPYISECNWVDIVAVVIILRMCYVGIKQGFGVEVFKMINLCFCSFIALHFYYSLGEFLHSVLPPLPTEPAATFSFLLLLIVITLIFRVLRDTFFVFFKKGEANKTSILLGGAIGALRGIGIAGLIAFGLVISQNHYLELSSRTSVLGGRFIKVPVKIYEFVFNKILSNVSADQSFNEKVIEAFKKKEEKQ